MHGHVREEGAQREVPDAVPRLENLPRKLDDKLAADPVYVHVTVQRSTSAPTYVQSREREKGGRL